MCLFCLFSVNLQKEAKLNIVLKKMLLTFWWFSGWSTSWSRSSGWFGTYKRGFSYTQVKDQLKKEEID